MPYRSHKTQAEYDNIMRAIKEYLSERITQKNVCKKYGISLSTFCYYLHYAKVKKYDHGRALVRANEGENPMDYIEPKKVAHDPIDIYVPQDEEKGKEKLKEKNKVKKVRTKKIDKKSDRIQVEKIYHDRQIKIEPKQNDIFYTTNKPNKPMTPTKMIPSTSIYQSPLPEHIQERNVVDLSKYFIKHNPIV